MTHLDVVPPRSDLEQALMDPGRSAGAGDSRLRAHLKSAGPRYVSLLLLPIIIAAWQWVSANELVHAVLLPEFTSVVASFGELVTSSSFPRHLIRTVTEILVSWGLGTVLGLSLGLLLANFPLLRRAYSPLLGAFEALPKVVIAPIVIIWLGFGISSKIVTGVVASVFPVFVTTLVGLSLVSRSEMSLMQALCASRWQIFLKLRLPTALPAIFGGMKIAMATATVAVVVAEFVGADGGLGYLTVQAKANFDVSGMFALVFVFMILGSGSFLLLEAIERKLVFWKK